jgi:hypothetical protein
VRWTIELLSTPTRMHRRNNSTLTIGNQEWARNLPFEC